MVTEKQKKILSKLFRKTGRTFQDLAREAGVRTVPDHLVELSGEQAQIIIDAHRGWLVK